MHDNYILLCYDFNIRCASLSLDHKVLKNEKHYQYLADFHDLNKKFDKQQKTLGKIDIQYVFSHCAWWRV